MRKILLPAILFLAGMTAALSAGATSVRVAIDAPDEDRVSAAIIGEVELPAVVAGESGLRVRVVCEANGGFRTGQAEMIGRADEGRVARVYWVEPELRAGEERRFRLEFEGIAGSAGAVFRFEDDEKGRDVFYGDRPVVRHVTVYDPERHMDTHKPYHQVYRLDGDGFLTKGPGGLYPHHKGIYLGWNHTYLGERRWDFWHARNVRQQHREYLHERELAGPVVGRKASLTDWIADGERAVVRDRREITIWRVADSEWILDYEIELRALEGDISLRGDAHHAGFQFRASQEVVDRQEETRYVQPDGTTPKGNEIFGDIEWMAFDFPLGDRRYIVTHIDHPENPAGTTYSTRRYGRFGAFFEHELKQGDPLVIRYRILVQDASVHGGKPPAYYEKRHADFARPVSIRGQVSGE